MSGENITVTVDLTDGRALALAQYLKRYIWTDVRQVRPMMMKPI